ncbi:MAG: AAA family ATPase, partial [Gaiellaceae bacterium]
MIVLLVYLASQTFLPRSADEPKKTYSELKNEVETNPENITQIVFSPKGRSIEATFKDGEKWKVNYPSDQSQIEFENLVAAQTPAIKYDSKGTGSSALGSILRTLLPLLLIFGLFIFLMSRMQGGGSKVMSFGKSRAKRVAPDSPKITFKDVAGVDEAVEELHEIKEFLENPKKFQALGARIPKGVLLYGPPGTGKTLLARSVAGEAGVP